jgi:hypothetical protein
MMGIQKFVKIIFVAVIHTVEQLHSVPLILHVSTSGCCLKRLILVSRGRKPEVTPVRACELACARQSKRIYHEAAEDAQKPSGQLDCKR